MAIYSPFDLANGHAKVRIAATNVDGAITLRCPTTIDLRKIVVEEIVRYYLVCLLGYHLQVVQIQMPHWLSTQGRKRNRERSLL